MPVIKVSTENVAELLNKWVPDKTLRALLFLELGELFKCADKRFSRREWLNLRNTEPRKPQTLNN